MTTTTLPYDMARCHGLRDTYTDSVRPLPMCHGCARWIDADKRGPHTPIAEPEARISRSAGGVWLVCDMRATHADDCAPKPTQQAARTCDAALPAFIPEGMK